MLRPVAIAGWCRKCGAGYVIMDACQQDNGTCSYKCTRNSRSRHRARKKGPCPMPSKRVYLSREEADAAAAYALADDGTLIYPYKCACGLYHMSRRPSLPRPRKP